MIRVLICDDQHMVADGLEAILSTSDTIEVVAKAHDGSEAIQLATLHKPDIVLMDLNMPKVNGVEATKEIRQRFSEMPVLILTTYDADEWVFDAIRAGASGYLLKDSPRETLLSAIEETVAGKTHVDPAIAGRLFHRVVDSAQHFAQPSIGLPKPHSTGQQASTLLAQLTEREVHVLRLLGQGMPNAMIAESLHMAEGTVRNHVSSILSKLDLVDRTQAALFALRNGLCE